MTCCVRVGNWRASGAGSQAGGPARPARANESPTMSLWALEEAVRQNISHAVARVILIALAMPVGEDFSCMTSLHALSPDIAR